MPIHLQNHKQSNSALFQTGAINGNSPKLHTATSFRKSRGGRDVKVLKSPDNNGSGNGSGLLQKMMPLRTKSAGIPPRNYSSGPGSGDKRKARRQRRRHSCGHTQDDDQPQFQDLPNGTPQTTDEPEGEDSFLTGMTIEIAADKDTLDSSSRRARKAMKESSSSSNNSIHSKHQGVRKEASLSMRDLRRRNSCGSTVAMTESSSHGLAHSYHHPKRSSPPPSAASHVKSNGALTSILCSTGINLKGRMGNDSSRSSNSKRPPSKRSRSSKRRPDVAQLPEQSQAVYFPDGDRH